MRDSKESKKYTFLDYQVFPHQRVILKSNNPNKLKLSKKSFDLLMLLIRKNGNVVTKQEMTETVWPNQVVTEAALSKQITRLRNELLTRDLKDQVIIETIRGVGVKLAPTVHETIYKSPSKSPKVNINKIVPIVIVLCLILFLIINYKNNGELKTPEISKQFLKTPVNIALIPIDDTDNWFNVGGTNYLYQRLQNHAEINTLPPNSKWFENKSKQSVAIQMTESDSLDYVLEIINMNKDREYVTQLVLRDNSGIVAKQNIQAESLTGLFDKMDVWIVKEIEINSQIKARKISSYQTTDYVLETYFRGKHVAINESYEKASQFLKTATNEDKDFLPAWIALAEVEAKLGNYNKALALIEIISNHKYFNPNSIDDMLVLKSKYLVGLNQLEEASLLIDQAINLSETSNDQSTLIDAITIKIQTHFNTGNINQKTVELLEKQILLHEKFMPDPYLMAISSYNLAATYHQLGQMDLAIKTINECIKLYTNTNNIRGIVVSKSLLSRLYKDKGDSGKALMVLESVDGLFGQIDGISEQQVYLQYKAENQIYYGLRNEATETIEKLHELNLKSNGLELKIVALGLSFELNQIHKDYQQSKMNAEQMHLILEKHLAGYPPIYEDLILTYEMFIAALTELPEKSRMIVNKNLVSNPNIKSFFEKEVRMIEAIILVKENKNIMAIEIYQDLLKEYVDANKIQDALYYAGYPLLDLLWENNKSEYIKTMNYLDEIATFKYPINIYKAQNLAFNKDYINAYLTMVELKSKSNQFWTSKDQNLLEQYQEYTTQ